MDLEHKLDLLAAAARYDVSCASSGSRRPAAAGGLGNTSVGGICHSWSDDGRCIALLKLLFSSHCIYDCAYCINRASNPHRRAAFTVDEVVTLTMNFYRRNYIEGLFLSSGVLRDPDYTMEQLTLVAKKLRQEQRFGGYIHLKTIPGASVALIQEAGRYADRISVNIELPSEQSLQLLAPQKNRHSILGPMGAMTRAIAASRATRRTDPHAPAFAPAGQSTQLIVGATPEPDRHILHLAEKLYEQYRLKRVYYSAYVPVNEDPRVTAVTRPDLRREHRLYQADWLVRRYGFQAAELLPESTANLDPDLDPKSAWALRHPEQFPVDINRAGREALLRVPGLGVQTVKQILATRRFASLRYEDVAAMGAVMKRARYFIACPGYLPPDLSGAPDRLRASLLPGRLRPPPTTAPAPRQMEFAFNLDPVPA